MHLRNILLCVYQHSGEYISRNISIGFLWFISCFSNKLSALSYYVSYDLIYASSLFWNIIFSLEMLYFYKNKMSIFSLAMLCLF